MGKMRHHKSGVCSRYSSPKVKYLSFAVALFDAKCVQSKVENATVEVFRCRHCGAWHVGKA